MAKTEVKSTESKYAKKLKVRKRLSRKLFPNSERVLTWPELLLNGVNKNG